MMGDRLRLRQLRANVALAFVVLALLLRVMVPSGWMPAAAGSGFSITLCTGMGAVSAWIDSEGKVHKEKPAESKPEHPCIFSGFSAALDLPAFDGRLIVPSLAPATFFVLSMATVAIGRGLAAPPPPPTGPPASL